MIKKTLRLLGIVILSSFMGAAHAIKVQEVKNKVGVKAWLVEDHTTPLIGISYAFKAGSAYDPLGKEGLGALYSRLFLESRKGLKSSVFMRKIEDLGGSVGVSIDKNYLIFKWRFPSQNRLEMMALIKTLVTSSQFDRSDFERVRDYLPGDTHITYTEADVLACKALYQKLYPNHPYGRSTHGTTDGIQSIVLEDLENYGKTLGRDQLRMAISGDVTPSQLSEFLETCFSHLPEKGPVRNLADVQGSKNGEILTIEKHTAQATVVFAQESIPDHHPDWFAGALLNYILGGGDFTSRLWVKLRDEMGLTYSVSTSVKPLQGAAHIIGGLATEGAQVWKVIGLIKEQWQLVQDRGVTARELEEAKSCITGQLATSLTNNLDVSQVLLNFLIRGYEPDFIEKRKARIEAVTLEQVNRLAKEMLDPKKLIFVVVGDVPPPQK